MMCPYCNQNHPEGTKYCPETGEKILSKMLSCPNEKCINYKKYILPEDSKFCPDCGERLSHHADIINKWSTISDFSDGSLIFGITLGATTLSDISVKGEQNVKYIKNFGYEIDINENVQVFIVVLPANEDEVKFFLSEFPEGSRSHILNETLTVNGAQVTCYSKFPFLADIGVSSEKSEKENIGALLKHGYKIVDKSTIKFPPADDNTNTILLINNGKYSHKNDILISLYNNSVISFWYNPIIVNV